MSAFTPPQQDELARLIQAEMQRSDLATLVRQLQGGALSGSQQRTVTVTWPGGSGFSSTVGFTHGLGPVRTLTQVQTQSGVGPAEVGITPGAGTLAVYAQALSGLPTAGTTADITVVYWEQ